jgi:hypothetical protein
LGNQTKKSPVGEVMLNKAKTASKHNDDWALDQ